MASQKVLVTFCFLGCTRFRWGKNCTTRDNRTGIKHLLELRLDFLIIQILGALLEEHLGTLTFLTDGRFLGETLHTAIVEEIGTKFLIVLEHRIEEIHEVCSLWRIVQTEAVLVR